MFIFAHNKTQTMNGSNTYTHTNIGEADACAVACMCNALNHSVLQAPPLNSGYTYDMMRHRVANSALR